jgi:hypothetical protein
MDKPAIAAADDEVHIHLNLAGLATLMGTIHEAMVRGRAELRLDWSGVSVSGGGSAGRVASLKLTWVERPGPDEDEPDPQPLRQTPVLETLG